MASLDVAPNLRGLWSTRAEYLLFHSPDELYEVRHQLRTIWSEPPNVRLPLVRTALRVDRLTVLRPLFQCRDPSRRRLVRLGGRGRRGFISRR